VSAPRPPWWLAPAALLGAALVRLLGRSWRIERLGTAERDARIGAGEACIFAFWHARLLPLVYTHRRRRIAVLVSRHHDGELIARIVERLGFVTARGSSTRGGDEAVRELLRLARRGHALAITPDGPRGPAEQAKAGLVYLASKTGLAVVPVATSARRALRLGSWDGFRVPWPFTRVVVGYGPPLAVPPALAEHEVESWRARIQGAIQDLGRELARRSGERS
jgi:hypothetical protein